MSSSSYYKLNNKINCVLSLFTKILGIDSTDELTPFPLSPISSGVEIDRIDTSHSLYVYDR